MLKNFLRDIVIKPKPWGREIWFAWTSFYAGKILEIKRGHRFSLQYHKKKQETQLVIQGKIKFTFGKNPKKLKTKVLCAGEKIDIAPRTIHRVEALEKTIIFEASTPELDDVVRVEDDYGRIK
ncbi:cupin [Candidatus Peregrinibacteria bacterium]|nr:cupin [Candidatus Peregrinibacteria bacterium]